MLTPDQERDLYSRMRHQAERLLTLRRWLDQRPGGSRSLVRRTVDAQVEAAIATCEALAGSFSFGETKAHRVWKEKCRMY